MLEKTNVVVDGKLSTANWKSIDEECPSDIIDQIVYRSINPKLM